MIDGRYGTILADPPWRFTNRTGKGAPEHKRLGRYTTLPTDEIARLPIAALAADDSHLYLWVPAALLDHGLRVMRAWGFTYKTTLVWEKVRRDGAPDGRCMGFYFRTATEFVLFGVRGHLRTGPPGRRATNVIRTVKREHSRKPDEMQALIETVSPGPYLELFARPPHRAGWAVWGDQAEERTMAG